jgi:hypothetical protein
MNIQNILRDNADASAVASLIKQGELTEIELRSILIQRNELFIANVNIYLEAK